jgi:hypothetical protein
LVGKLGELLNAPPVLFLMIARLNRIGERCRSALRLTRLVSRVLFVALRGLYRSSCAQDPTADPAFRRAKHATYRKLWAMLEDVYWKVRGSNSDAPTLRAMLRDVNAFVGENFLYIREADHVLVTQYILSLQRLRRTSHPMNENDASAVWEGTGGRTPSTVADSAIQEAVGLRNRVLQELRHALVTE